MELSTPSDIRSELLPKGSGHSSATGKQQHCGEIFMFQ